jgi:hypothetical protein
MIVTSRIRFCAALLLLGMASAFADEASQVLDRYKAATGGDAWNHTSSLHSSGALSTGGLEGRFDAIVDLNDGRSASHYVLGPVEGAQGFDGERAWSRDPGGEVAVLDAPEAIRRGRSQAWLDAYGYWYPNRLPAVIGKPERREQDGRAFDVVQATPKGGDTVSLWFDRATGLLARIDQKEDRDQSITHFDDYREVGPLRLPFHSSNDRIDAAGRTDPRAHSEVRFTEFRRNEAVVDADFARPQTRSSSRIANEAGVTRIPIKLANNHIYADAFVDGKKARFIVDTGGVNLLTPAAAKKFGLDGAGKLAARGVGDESVDLALARAREVRVGDAILDNPVFYVVDLGSLSAIEGENFDGLVGYEFFSRYGVTIDYAGHELTLATAERFAPPEGAHSIPFDLAERIPIVQGTLDGIDVRLSVDTGSRVSLTLHSPFVAAHDLVERYQAAPEAVMGWGVGGPSRGRPARFGTLRLGDLDIGKIAGDLYTGNKGAFASADTSGNLGGGVFRRFTLAFDYANRRLFLAPNADYGKPDDYDRSGLFLFADADVLKVADVAIASAGARAGLAADDRIVSIDGEAVAERTLEQWRLRLRELPAGTRLAIAYERSGTPAKATLVLADRIPAKSMAR